MRIGDCGLEDPGRKHALHNPHSAIRIPHSNNRAFSLIEVAITLAIIAVLAGVLTPIVGSMIDHARVTRARADVESIADAILNFNKNTGKWPIFTTGVSITTSTPVFQVLTGPGNDPLCSTDCLSWLPSDSSVRGDLPTIMDRNTLGYTTSGKFAWRGPYLNDLGTDPWGYRYVVNAANLAFGLNRAGFVLSAGPNGTIQTAFIQNISSNSAAVTIGGDDIVARIR